MLAADSTMGTTVASTPLSAGDILSLLLFLVVVIGISCFPRYRYTIEGEFLLIRRFVFRWVPFGRFRIRLDEILAIEEGSPWSWPWWLLHYGRVFTLDRVLLTLKAPRYGVFRHVDITPEYPAFVNELAARSGAELRTRPRAADILLDRLPLRVADAFAVYSGLVLIFLVGVIIDLALGPQPAGSGQDFPLGIPGLVVTTLSVLGFALSMWSHAGRVALVEEDPVFWVWLVGINFVQPLAWVYYLTIYRPRRVARERSGAP